MSKKVFIDPGHGGSDSGAIGVNNLLEKDINLSIAQKVALLLSNRGILVNLSRVADSTMSLNSRTTSANSWDANCYVSIHCNAFNGKAKGVETYSYSNTTNDLAGFIHNEIIESKTYTIDRGLKVANFYVLRESKMRACLVEMAFIDNDEDSLLLNQKQDELALAIAKGIAKYLGIQFDDEIKNPNVFYRVVCGSFNDKANANQRVNDLKNSGYEDTFIDVYYKED